jgi:hypothetical protein
MDGPWLTSPSSLGTNSLETVPTRDTSRTSSAYLRGYLPSRPHPGGGQESVQAQQQTLSKPDAVIPHLSEELPDPHLLVCQVVGARRSLPGQRPSHLPNRHLGLDVQLSQRPSHRDAVMAILDEVNVLTWISSTGGSTLPCRSAPAMLNQRSLV